MRHLDSNIVVAYLNGSREIAALIKAHRPDLAMSSVAVAELLYGARNSDRAEKNLASLRALLEFIPVASFDAACAEVYSRARVELRRKGRPAPALDLLIGATA